MLAWLDTETTGLNPKTDRILEVGMIITTDDLQEVWRVSRVCRFLGDLEKINPAVRVMHDVSGLWAECEATENTMASVEAELVAMLIRHQVTDAFGKAAKEHTVPLAGSNIGFDRSFLREHMPKLLDCFHYRSVDVSTLTELARRWYPSVYESRPGAGSVVGHRALTDLEVSIALLKHYREAMFVGGPTMSMVSLPAGEVAELRAAAAELVRLRNVLASSPFKIIGASPKR